MGNYQRLPDLEIELAAQDSDLVALYESEIFGTTLSVDPTRAELIQAMNADEVVQLRTDIMRAYDISEHDWNKVIGRSIAQIVGMQVGLTNE